MKIILCILDGWGHSEDIAHNAIKLANTPCYDSILKNNPHSFLEASGKSVGLPDGQMGNSEVGHIAIGSGRCVKQDLPRIGDAFTTGEISHNRYIKEIISKFRGSEHCCHLIGIVSDGGVHGHLDHIIALAALLKKSDVTVYLHVITDGRDVLPKSAKQYISKILEAGIDIASISGRFYAMDRDNRWDRTEKAYKTIVQALGEKFDNPINFIDAQYQQGTSDEFITPTSSQAYTGIEDGDCIICTNFRADRMRQFALSLLSQNNAAFDTKTLACSFYSFRPYSSEIAKSFKTIFENEPIAKSLGAVIADNNMSQLRIAETEKYAHVTYFFNGGNELELPLEKRILIQSPKVSTYDLAPEMSAEKILDALEVEVVKSQPDFICMNIANADMVGHSGNIPATIKAIETIDKCLARMLSLANTYGYEILITADHGNAECMLDEASKQPLTSHTTNKVPLIYIGSKQLKLKDGELRDIAPTILDLFGLQKPQEMTGNSLIEYNK